ncbi:MAG: hypothetical protein GY756_05815 [bacterium]|nr:hypothetical protein [bacterium]
MSKIIGSTILICLFFVPCTINAIKFHGTGAGTTYDSAKLDKFDKSTALNKHVAPFYITVSIKEGACLTESYLNYNQIPVIIMNYACNVTGCNSKGIIYTTAGDVNSHYYYAIRDPHFSKDTGSRIEAFVLWPGCNIRITKFKPIDIQKKKSGYTSKIPVDKFKLNNPTPHYSGNYRKLIPFSS